MITAKPTHSEMSVDEDCPRSLRSTFDEDVVPMFIVTMTVRHGEGAVRVEQYMIKQQHLFIVIIRDYIP